MKVPCGGFDLDESVFNVDKNSKQVKLNSPISYDYMPEGYPKKDGWAIEWDGNTKGKTSVVSPDGTFYKISDMVLTYDDLLGAKAVNLKNPQQYLVLSEDNINQQQISDNFILFKVAGADIYVVSEDNVEVGGLKFPEKGSYVIEESQGAFILVKDIITPMAREFLPSEVNELIMNSSTPDSTKKFKITVNDSGAISATEVT